MRLAQGHPFELSKSFFDDNISPSFLFNKMFCELAARALYMVEQKVIFKQTFNRT